MVLNEKPDGEVNGIWRGHTVSLTDREVFEYYLTEEVRSGWCQHPLLRDHRTVIFTDGVCPWPGTAWTCASAASWGWRFKGLRDVPGTSEGVCAPKKGGVMTALFDLISQPWIPCVRRDDVAAEVGLRGTLAQAHQLRDLQGESPLVTAALHRLLLALLHRVFGPDGHDAWAALWQAGRFGSIRRGRLLGAVARAVRPVRRGLPLLPDRRHAAEAKRVTKLAMIVGLQQRHAL